MIRLLSLSLVSQKQTFTQHLGDRSGCTPWTFEYFSVYFERTLLICPYQNIWPVSTLPTSSPDRYKGIYIYIYMIMKCHTPGSSLPARHTLPFLNATQSQDSACHATPESYKTSRDLGAPSTRRNKKSMWTQSQEFVCPHS